MRMLLSTSIVAVCLWGLSSFLAAADVQPEVVRRAKRATALVVQPRGFATAFCIDQSGYFLTNEHVVSRAKDGSVELVLHPGEKNQRKLPARVVRTDEDNDLALLHVSADGALTALKLADDPDLVETQTVMVVGYPFGAALRTQEQEYPNVSVNLGRISSLRTSNGRLERIQTDAEVNAGNSGGPMLNVAGEVIGIVQAKVRFSGVNFAIPSAFAHAMLAEPEVRFEFPRIAYQQRHKPQSLTARVVTFDGKERKFDVRLKIGQGPSQREIHFHSTKDGVYTAKAAIVTQRQRARLPVVIRFSGGEIRGEIDDAPVKAQAAGEKLSELRHIERRGNVWRFAGRNGKEFYYAKLPLERLTVHLGETSIDVPVDESAGIDIRQPPPEKGVLPAEVVVSLDGRAVASLRGQIIIEGAPATTAQSSPADDGSPETRLPAAEGDFIALNGDQPWPEFLETPPISVSKDGLVGLGRRYVRTKSGRFLERNFTFQVLLKMEKDDGIAFVGLGEGRGGGAYDEPEKSVHLKIHSRKLSNGWVQLDNANKSARQSLGNVDAGTHRVIIRKRGEKVTFAIDVDNDGPTSDDLMYTYPKFREIAPFLHEKNAYLFFGDGGAYQSVSLTVEGQ